MAVIAASSLVSPLARVSSGACLGAHAVVEAGAQIGEGAQIGDGVHIGADVLVGPDVRIGPHAVVLGAEESSAGAAKTELRKGVRVGASATLLAGVLVEANAVVRPGSVVTRSVPAGAIVEGNPATITGYVDTASGLHHPVVAMAPTGRAPSEPTIVNGVTVHHFPVIPDLRGNLTVGEFERQIPFAPLRYFMVFGVPSREIRGEHAHLRCHQFLICVRGSCAVVADDGQRRVEVVLDSPSRGLYLPPMTWGVQYKYTPDAMLLVFASHHYEPDDYVRDYSRFLDLARQP
jgi:acetyltransferase-like isoleucine patch superfamily enzyme